eukprot:SAG11_NODE_1112_length_5821_cov_43.477281_8_plen_57_part_00
MAHMRDQMIEQSEQLIALETLEIEKHRQIEKKKKKKVHDAPTKHSFLILMHADSLI